MAAPTLHLDLNRNTVEHGKFLRAELYAVTAGADLQTLDLSPLRRLFGVVLREDPDWVEDRRWPKQQVQRLRMRLYPLQPGTVTLPSLQLAGLRSEARSIQVSEGGFKGSAIHFSSHASTTNPWQRQQIILSAEVSTSQAFVRLAVPDDWRPAGFEVVPLPMSSRPAQTGSGSVLGIGWALFPLLPGKHKLRPPAIEYRVSGRSARRYYPAALTLSVKPLPPYVPPTMPVGRITLQSDITPPGYLPTDALAWWTLRIKANALLPRWLPTLQDQIQSNDSLQFLTAKTSRATAADQTGVHGSLTLQMPFKPLSAGRTALPQLSIDYFDPTSGRLRRLQLEPSQRWVYPPAAVWPLAILLMLAVLWLLLQIAASGRRRWQRAAARRQLLKAMASEPDPLLLRAGLKRLATLDGLPQNQSLQQWGRQWRGRYQTEDGFDGLIQQLSDACYRGAGSSGADYAGLRSRLIQQLRRPRLHRYRRKWLTPGSAPPAAPL